MTTLKHYLKLPFVALYGALQRAFAPLWYRHAAPEHLQERWLLNMGTEDVIIEQDLGFLEQIRRAGKLPIGETIIKPGCWSWFAHGTVIYSTESGDRAHIATCYTHRHLKQAQRIYRGIKRQRQRQNVV